MIKLFIYLQLTVWKTSRQCCQTEPQTLWLLGKVCMGPTSNFARNIRVFHQPGKKWRWIAPVNRVEDTSTSSSLILITCPSVTWRFMERKVCWKMVFLIVISFKMCNYQNTYREMQKKLVINIGSGNGLVPPATIYQAVTWSNDY